MSDRLFRYLEELHQGRPWGTFLDAGSGWSSLEWILTLKYECLTAVTADPTWEAPLRAHFGHRLRSADRVVVGNWVDPQLLAGESFDTVLVDYLLGAVERFAPYFQTRLLSRLRPLVRGDLYLIGLEPYPDPGSDPAGQLVCAIAHLRDACFTLAGEPFHREYPSWWVAEQLACSGFEIRQRKGFPISYGAGFVKAELDVCRRQLAKIADPELAAAVAEREQRLREQALNFVERQGTLNWGADYVIAARVATD